MFDPLDTVLVIVVPYTNAGRSTAPVKGWTSLIPTAFVLRPVACVHVATNGLGALVRISPVGWVGIETDI